MKLEIGGLDCTAWVDAERSSKVVRKLNAAAELMVVLVGEDVPAITANAKVALRFDSGEALFTGYVAEAPTREYLGWGQADAVYRYTVRARGEEERMDRAVLAQRPPFVMRTAGEIVREITEAVAPGEFGLTEVSDVDVVTQFSAGLKKWSECARAVAQATRSAYRVHEGRVRLKPVGESAFVLDEQDEKFSPERLQMRSPGEPVNALTVLGKSELDGYVKDYFVGDGYELRFNLSETPYGRSTSTVFEQEYDKQLDPAWWKTSGTASVNSGRLWMQGAGAVDLAELVELRGALALQHGEVQFQSASDGVIGGLYDGPSLVAGFTIAKAGAESRIVAVIHGTVGGEAITTQAGHRYVMSTRLYVTETLRANERYHSSESVEGGGERRADARVVLEVHEVDPNNAASLVTAATVLFDGVIQNIPAFCRYRLVQGNDMQCSVTYTRMLRMPMVAVRSALPNQPFRTRLVGAMVDGAECRIYNQDLTFFTSSVPASNEKIVAEYRVARRSVAQVSVQEPALPQQEGKDGAPVEVVSPAAKTSEDCANAGRAILKDQSKQAWSGEYATWSDCLESDVWPGDAVEIRAASLGCETRAIVREVEIGTVDPANGRSWYAIKFANEAAEPIAIQTTPVTAGEVTRAIVQERERFTLANLPQAAVTEITSTSVTIDTGLEPIAGGGFEVRRTDSGWNPLVDRNLIGRFQTRLITLPRLSRVQTYCVRQYDGAGQYSSCATQLHVDYPL
jgi:hypothetical protein